MDIPGPWQEILQQTEPLRWVRSLRKKTPAPLSEQPCLERPGSLMQPFYFLIINTVQAHYRTFVQNVFKSQETYQYQRQLLFVSVSVFLSSLCFFYTVYRAEFIKQFCGFG